jgi:hypothetical protein
MIRRILGASVGLYRRRGSALALFAKEFAVELIVKNEHSVDRVVRVLLGLALLSLAFLGPKTPWGYVGIVPLLTGLMGTCPLYRIFGISTCPVPPATKSSS